MYILTPHCPQKLVVHILHDHIGMPQTIFVSHGQTVPKELTITGLMKPAQSTGKGRFSGPIVANDANYLSLYCCKADVVQNGSLLIVKGYIVKFQDRI